MTFQSTVRQFATSGLPGEVSNEGPLRAKSWTLRSEGRNNSTNPIGFAYTWLEEGVATPGGVGTLTPPLVQFLGILIQPKAYALQGTAAGTLEPAYYLNDEDTGELLTTGEIWVNLYTVGTVGNSVSYEVATGALGDASIWVPDNNNTTYAEVPTAIIIEQNKTLGVPGLAKIRITY